jgi:hypothetical protein
MFSPAAIQQLRAWLGPEHWDDTSGTSDLDRFHQFAVQLWQDGVIEVRGDDLLAAAREAGCAYPRMPHQGDAFQRYVVRLDHTSWTSWVDTGGGRSRWRLRANPSTRRRRRD